MFFTGKKMMLGTAQWGWTVNKAEAFLLLDDWLKAGFRQIDCATNYPINRRPADFRGAEKILEEYIAAHGLDSLDITMKIGSLDNLRSPDINLAPSFIQMMAEEYLRLLGQNLGCVMFHWDNRSEISDIRASLEMLQHMCRQHNLRPGLSGIKHPQPYAEALSGMPMHFDIQVKHNVLTSDLSRYAPVCSGGVAHDFYAYGINAGGIKISAPYSENSTFITRGGLPDQWAPTMEAIANEMPKWNTASVRPPVKTMNHAGLIFSGLNPELTGILLGVSSVAQLRESLEFCKNLEVFDYSDVYSSLNKIHLRVSEAPGR